MLPTPFQVNIASCVSFNKLSNAATGSRFCLEVELISFYFTLRFATKEEQVAFSLFHRNV